MAGSSRRRKAQNEAYGKRCESRHWYWRPWGPWHCSFPWQWARGITYFRSPKENRSGWTLANGSLLVIVSGVALSGALMSELGVLRMITILSFAAGFLAASIGVSQIAAGIANKTGRGWALLGGGLNLLVSFFMCVNPVVSWFALTTVWGAYLIADAITLLLAERWAQTGSRT